jgi:uncharacterized protein (TIGR03067 family)
MRFLWRCSGSGCLEGIVPEQGIRHEFRYIQGAIMIPLFCPLIMLATSVVGGGGDEEVRKEMEVLVGKWKAVGFEAGGQPLPKEQVAAMDFTMIIGADGKSTGKTAQEEFQFTMTIDPKKSPKTLDNEHTSGAAKGAKQYGIYKVEGGRWIVCASNRGAAESARPKSFDTKGTSNVVFIFERVKAR